VSAVGLGGILFGNRQFEIGRDKMLAGIRFPKGSKITNDFAGNPASVVLSEDIEINGLPAGKGTTIALHEGKTLTSITTGRTWIYRGISVPAGSTISLQGTSGISEISLSQGTEIQGTLFPSSSKVSPQLRLTDGSPFPMADGSRVSLAVSPSLDTMVYGIPCKGGGRGRGVVWFSSDEQAMQCNLARPFDVDGYKLKASSIIMVRRGKVVVGTLREDCVLSGVRWPAGVRFRQLVAAAETRPSFQYEVPSAVALQVEDMLIQGPSILEFDADKLRSVSGQLGRGYYVWSGQRYRSYRLSADGQIQRELEWYN
jgi:hypothetical protein